MVLTLPLEKAECGGLQDWDPALLAIEAMRMPSSTSPLSELNEEGWFSFFYSGQAAARCCVELIWLDC